MLQYLGLAAIVLGLNVMPVFAPPTWSVLVLYRLNSHLSPIPLVIIGAISAGIGRFLLAKGTGLLRAKIPEKQLKNLQSAGEMLERNKRAKFTTIFLFIISPFPSAQLFEAAGLIGRKLLPLTIAFFSGRLVSYSFYVVGASQLKDRNLGSLMTNSLKSPWGIALQLASIAGIYALTQINWHRFLPKSHNSGGRPDAGEK